MKQKDSGVDFIVHLPAKIRREDRQKVTKAFEEIFFGQDRLSPHVEKILKGKVDIAKINSMLGENRFVTERRAASPHLEILAKTKGLDLTRSSKLFRILVNDTSGRLRRLAKSIEASDGRKALFVTVRPRGFSLDNELDLSVLLDATVGMCRTVGFSDPVMRELTNAGVAVDEIVNNKRAPLTRLSPESRATLESYGMNEHEFGGISVIPDPVSQPDQISASFLRRRRVTIEDFGLASDAIN